MKKLFSRNQIWIALAAFAVVCAAALAVLLFSNRGKAADDGYRYVLGVSQYRLDDAWNLELQNDIEQEAAKYPDVKVVFTDAGGNDVRQKNDIEMLRDMGCDAVLVVPGNRAYLTQSMTRLYEQGVVLGILGVEPLNDAYSFRVNCSRYDIGYAAGRYIGSIAKRGAILLEIRDQNEEMRIDDITKGFRDGIEMGKGITIDYVVIGYGLKDKTEERVAEILQKSPAVDAIFAFSDLMGWGAYDVAQRAGLSPLIVGVGGEKGPNEGLDLIHKGVLDATVFYPTGGKEAIDSALKALGGVKERIEIRLQPTVITKENVDTFR